MSHNNYVFEVKISTGSLITGAFKTWAMRNFCNSEEEIKEEPISITEYQPLEIEFLPKPDVHVPEIAKLYLDGLDAIDMPLPSDWDGPYIKCDSKICLYKGYKNEMDYPWVPGYYRIAVLWENEWFYTLIKIMPRHVTEDQLDIMRKELEDNIRGLAIEIILRNKGIGKSDNLMKLPERLYQYTLLEDQFVKFNQVVSDILEKPHQHACQSHEVVPLHRARMWDDKTLKWLCSDIGINKNNGSLKEPQVVLAPRSNVRFDLPENKWVKTILRGIIDISRDIQDAIEKTAIWKKSEICYNTDRLTREINFLETVLARLISIQGQLWQLYKSHPLEEIEPSLRPIPITIGLLRDYRYCYIYQFWKKINSKLEVRVESAVEYQWKRTELLYEYWCFTQTIRVLQQIGFTAINGWIFDKNFEEDFFIPHISDGTTVKLDKADVQIIITYNQSIKFTVDESVQNNIPLFCRGRHNKPDMRLDIYKSGQYLFSVIFESKYSQQKNVWDQKRIHEYHLWNHNMQQLNEYKKGFTRNDDWERDAIKHVVALYAGRAIESEVTNIPTHQITLLQLKPGTNLDHFKKYIEELLAKECN